MHYRDSTLERARDIARELTMFNRFTKVQDELMRLDSNRPNSMLLELLEITSEQIETAKERAEFESERAYKGIEEALQC